MKQLDKEDRNDFRTVIFNGVFFICNWIGFDITIYLEFNRGKGGIRLSGEFKRSLQTSMDMKARLPSFMDRSKRFGSIGWGVKRDESLPKQFHNKSVE